MKNLVLNEMKQKTCKHFFVNDVSKQLPYFEFNRKLEKDIISNIKEIDENGKKTINPDDKYTKIQNLKVNKLDYDIVLKNEIKKIIISDLSADIFFNINFEEGKNTLILKFVSDEEKNSKEKRNIEKEYGYLKNYIQFNIKENSDNKILIIFDHDVENMIEYDKINFDCMENSTTEAIFAIFGKMEQYTYVETTPKRNTSIEIAGLYMFKEKQELDLLVKDNQEGIDSKYDLDIYGVLDDEAKKSCKMIIDFINGSTNSQGMEKEEVVLLTDNAKSKSCPILLCNEEEVTGNHGATIGKIPEEKIFYLQSRGFTKEEAKILTIIATFEKVFSKLEKFDETIYSEEFDELRLRIRKFLNDESLSR